MRMLTMRGCVGGERVPMFRKLSIQFRPKTEHSDRADVRLGGCTRRVYLSDLRVAATPFMYNAFLGAFCQLLPCQRCCGIASFAKYSSKQHPSRIYEHGRYTNGLEMSQCDTITV